MEYMRTSYTIPLNVSSLVALLAILLLSASMPDKRHGLDGPTARLQVFMKL